MFLMLRSRGNADLCNTGTYVGYQILLVIASENVPWSFSEMGTLI